MGRVGKCLSQPASVDHMCKKMWARGRRGILQRGRYMHLCRRGGRLQSYSLTDYRLLPMSPQFFYFLKFMFWYNDEVRDGPSILRKMGVQQPHFFESCPYTWKGEIFHSSWSLEISFFYNFLLKLDNSNTFVSTIGIFFLM